MSAEAGIKNHRCPVCTGKISQAADLSGGTRLIRRPGLVKQFPIGDQLSPGWTLRLFFHGRMTQTNVLVIELALEGVYHGRSPRFLEIALIITPGELRQDQNFRTILGVARTKFAKEVPPAAINMNVVPGNFLVVGDKDGKSPVTPVQLPLAHIWAGFAPLE